MGLKFLIKLGVSIKAMKMALVKLVYLSSMFCFTFISEVGLIFNKKNGMIQNYSYTIFKPILP